MMLETDSIAFASPATVSRCGVVYFGAPCDLWKHVLSCWIAKVRPEPGLQQHHSAHTAAWLCCRHRPVMLRLLAGRTTQGLPARLLRQLLGLAVT